MATSGNSRLEVDVREVLRTVGMANTLHLAVGRGGVLWGIFGEGQRQRLWSVDKIRPIS